MKLPALVHTLLAALAVAPIAMFAADETVTGNLTIEQNLLVHQKIEVGETADITNTSPAYSLQANSLWGNTSIEQTIYGTTVAWNWMASNGTASKQLLKLEDSGKLSLYSPSSPTSPMIVLDASMITPAITVAGKKVVTEGNIGEILASSGGEAGQIAVGIASRASGGYAVVLGSYSSAGGTYAVTIGSDSHADYDNATAVGGYSYAWGELATALGNSSNAGGNYTIAIGGYSYATGEYAISLGYCTSALQPHQVALGSFNKPLDDAFLMLGNGTDYNQRSNLFVIMKDGRGIFRNTNYVEPTTPVAIQEKEALTVEGSATIKGDAKVTGTLRVKPAGDLPMGIFTAGTQP